MLNCNHDKHLQKFVKKSFLGEEFKFKTTVCDKCDSFLWDNDIEKKFNTWIDELYHNRREKFQVQFSLSKNIHKCIKELLSNYPSIKEAMLLRALVTTYIEHISKNRKLNKFFEKNMEQDIYSSFEKSPSINLKVQFKPRAMIEYMELGNMINTPFSKLIENILKKLMAFFVTNDPLLKEFWQKEIKKHVDIILKAA